MINTVPAGENEAGTKANMHYPFQGGTIEHTKNANRTILATNFIFLYLTILTHIT
jgi:hypothetical protein